MSRPQRTVSATSEPQKTASFKRNPKRVKPSDDMDVTDYDETMQVILDEIISLKNIVVSCSENVNILCEENKCLKKEIIGLQKEIVKINSENKKDVHTNLALEIKKIINKDKKQFTYADQLKQNNEPAIVVIPKKTQNSDDTKNDIRNSISPSKISVDSIRNGTKGAVIIKCKDNKSSQFLKSTAAEKMGEKYEIKTSEMKNPKIKIINITEVMDEDCLLNKIKTQNTFIKNSADIKLVKMINMTKKRNSENYTAIIQTDAETYVDIMKQEKLSIGWDRCRVFEHTYIVRCFKCLGFNHISKVCTKIQLCVKCGGEHDQHECLSNETKCANCIIAVSKLGIKLDIYHHANSMECCVLQRHIETERKKIQQFQK